MGFLSSLADLRNKQSKPNRVENRSRYRAVEVIANGPDCCEAVRAIAGKRFLSSEVPELPLGGCDANDCKCSYELFEDRRTRLRRASRAGFDTAGRARASGKRDASSPGRRSDD